MARPKTSLLCLFFGVILARPAGACEWLLTRRATRAPGLRISERRLSAAAAGEPRYRRLVDALDDLYARLDESLLATVARETWATGGQFAMDIRQDALFTDFPAWDRFEVRRAYGDLPERLRLDLGPGASAVLACALATVPRLTPARTEAPLEIMRGPVGQRILRDGALRRTLLAWIERLVDEPLLHRLLNSGQTLMKNPGFPPHECGAADVKRALHDLRRHEYTPLATFVALNAYLLFLTGSAFHDRIRPEDGLSRDERRMAVAIGSTMLLGQMRFDQSVDDLTYPALALAYGDPLPPTPREIKDAIDAFAKTALAQIPEPAKETIEARRAEPPPPSPDPLPRVPRRRRDDSTAAFPSRPVAGTSYAVPEKFTVSFETPAVRWLERHPSRARAVLDRLASLSHPDFTRMSGHQTARAGLVREMLIDERTSVLLAEMDSAWTVLDITTPEFVRVKLRVR